MDLLSFRIQIGATIDKKRIARLNGWQKPAPIGADPDCRRGPIALKPAFPHG